MKRFILTLLILVLAWALGGLSWAAEKYPNKPITFLVPWGAGGMTDVTSRLLAEKFKSELGQPVLVVNKPGANGAIGLKYALSQKADGYTVVIGPMTDCFAGPYFLGGEPFDFKDVSFVAGYMPQQRVLFTTGQSADPHRDQPRSRVLEGAQFQAQRAEKIKKGKSEKNEGGYLLISRSMDFHRLNPSARFWRRCSSENIIL